MNNQDTTPMQEESQPYADVPTRREALTSPWTWIGVAIMILSTTGPILLVDASIDAGIGAIIGFAGATIAWSVIKRV